MSDKTDAPVKSSSEDRFYALGARHGQWIGKALAAVSALFAKRK